MNEQTALEIPLPDNAAANPATAKGPARRTPRPPEHGAGAQIIDAARPLIDALVDLPLDERVSTLNALRVLLHEQSPFRREPVDLVLWEKADTIEGNSYNPNAVAPRQMELLRRSITVDGLTQPVVSWRPKDADTANETASPVEVVDGFHRHLIGKNDSIVAARLHGYLPITIINTDREALEDRQAATIRHNAARGVHTIEGLSEMVLQLMREKKGFAWFEENLGMQPDEVTRLAQVSGLAAAFADHEFTEAWEADSDPFSSDALNTSETEAAPERPRPAPTPAVAPAVTPPPESSAIPWDELDPGIADLVAAFSHLPGIITVQSCEGHPDRDHMPAEWNIAWKILARDPEQGVLASGPDPRGWAVTEWLNWHAADIARENALDRKIHAAAPFANTPGESTTYWITGPLHAEGKPTITPDQYLRELKTAWDMTGPFEVTW